LKTVAYYQLVLMLFLAAASCQTPEKQGCFLGTRKDVRMVFDNLTLLATSCVCLKNNAFIIEGDAIRGYFFAKKNEEWVFSMVCGAQRKNEIEIKSPRNVNAYIYITTNGFSNISDDMISCGPAYPDCVKAVGGKIGGDGFHMTLFSLNDEGEVYELSAREYLFNPCNNQSICVALLVRFPKTEGIHSIRNQLHNIYYDYISAINAAFRLVLKNVNMEASGAGEWCQVFSVYTNGLCNF